MCGSFNQDKSYKCINEGYNPFKNHFSSLITRWACKTRSLVKQVNIRRMFNRISFKHTHDLLLIFSRKSVHLNSFLIGSFIKLLFTQNILHIITINTGSINTGGEDTDIFKPFRKPLICSSVLSLNLVSDGFVWL